MLDVGISVSGGKMIAIVVGQCLMISLTNIAVFHHQHLSNVWTVERGLTVSKVRSRRCQNIVTLDQEEMRVLVQDVTTPINTARNWATVRPTTHVLIGVFQ